MATHSPHLCVRRRRLWGIHSPLYHLRELPVFHSPIHLPLHLVPWAAKSLVQKMLKASFPVAMWASWLPACREGKLLLAKGRQLR